MKESSKNMERNETEYESALIDKSHQRLPGLTKEKMAPILKNTCGLGGGGGSWQ